MRGRWTVPGYPYPSSHLIAGLFNARCGRYMPTSEQIAYPPERQPTDEPPARGKTCESCLRYSRRDG